MGTTIQGINGNVTFAAAAPAKLDAWSADIELANAETTGFIDGGYRVFEPTLASITGSMSGTCDDTLIPFPVAVIGANPIVPATLTAEVILTAEAGNTYTFNAVISGVSLTRPEDGKMDFVMNFESDSHIAVAWN